MIEEKTITQQSLEKYWKSFQEYSYQVLFNLIRLTDNILEQEGIEEVQLEIELFVNNKFLHYESPHFYIKGKEDFYYSKMNEVWPTSIYILNKDNIFTEDLDKIYNVYNLNKDENSLTNKIEHFLYEVEHTLSNYQLNIFDHRNDGRFERSVYWKKILKEDKDKNNYFYRTKINKNNLIELISFFGKIDKLVLEKDYRLFVANNKKEKLENSLEVKEAEINKIKKI